MILNESDIDKIAQLAKLKPTVEEKKRLLVDLNRVLEYMAIINELDTGDVEGETYFDPGPTPLRDDIIRKGLDHKKAMKNVPVAQKGLMTIPEVIKKAEKQ